MDEQQHTARVEADLADAPWSGADHHGTPVVATAPVARSTIRALHRATGLAPNVTEAELVDGDWQVDEHCAALGREDPGPPVPGGPFLQAWDLVRAYRMVDPRIVRACWYAGEPLAGRLQVLEGRFGPLRFTMPVRVGPVVEQDVVVDGRAARVAGWDYTTLAGHLERGRQDWTVWKWDDGTVEFRTHVVSRRARQSNPIVGAGLLVFGRSMQLLSAARVRRRLRQAVGYAGDEACTEVGLALRDVVAGTGAVASV